MLQLCGFGNFDCLKVGTSFKVSNRSAIAPADLKIGRAAVLETYATRKKILPEGRISENLV